MINRICLLLILLTGLSGASVFAQSSACLSNRHVVSYNGGKIPIEPSGLVYLKDSDIFVGVSDNYDVLEKLNAQEYAIFWFRDDGQPNLLAYPLLDHQQALQLNLYDLEGIAMDEKHNFYVFASLSLHASKPVRDSLFRFQAFKFQIQALGKDLFQISSIELFGQKMHGYWRDWLLNVKEIPWSLNHKIGRPETEDGLNLEALAISPERNLIIGLRGPIFYNQQTKHWDALAIEITIPSKPDELPAYVNSYYLPNTAGKKYGFRALSPLPNNSGWYVAVLGPTNTEVKPFEVFLWNVKTRQIQSMRRMTESQDIVWEGAAVTNITTEKGKQTVRVALIDDNQACFKYIDLPFY
jgi:hypothetical protein